MTLNIYIDKIGDVVDVAVDVDFDFDVGIDVADSDGGDGGGRTAAEARWRVQRSTDP